MRTIFIALALIVLQLSAYADPSYAKYSNPDHGFEIELPEGGGIVHDEYSDPEWTTNPFYTDSTVMVWEPLGRSSVRTMVAAAAHYDHDVTDGDLTTYVQNYQDGIVEEGGVIERVENVTDSAGGTWTSILASVVEDDGATSYIEAFAARYRGSVYNMLFIYSEPNGSGAQTARSLLGTFGVFNYDGPYT
jgi:hypothetical protein